MEVNVTQTSIDLLSSLFDIIEELFDDKNNNNDNQLKSEFDLKWNELLQEMDNNKYYASSMFCVYYHLRLKNWRIGCGTKYGAHFLLYTKQNKEKTNKKKRIHSKYLILHNFDPTNDLKLHCYVRLCKSINKTLVLTSFSQENVSEFNQKSVMNEKWLNNLTLKSMCCNIVQ